MASVRQFSIETLAAQAGRPSVPESGGVTHSIDLSTTFEQNADGSQSRGFVYARNSNPVRRTLEMRVAELETGVAAAAFSSGSAATAGVFQTLSSGDHVIAPADVYHGTAVMLREMFSRWDVQSTFVDFTDPDRVEDAVKPSTRLIWTETPSNPLLKVVDLKAISEIAAAAGVVHAVDNTWATPILQRPMELGADMVVHSSTKYLGGHSDVMGGLVVAKETAGPFEKVVAAQVRLGAVPSPFDCWLVLRGIRTLHLRMAAHCANAAQIAEYLEGSRKVVRVYYPGIPTHPQHQIARRQMSAFGGMVSFEVAGGIEEAKAAADSLRLITRATSLGGTESLIDHRASTEGPGSTTPQNLLRMSVGIENVNDLIADLDQALESA